jgi:formylglycine-generating enzyme required for sulfatase activity
MASGVVLGALSLAAFLHVNAAPARVITNSIGMKFVLIPAGDFRMGAPESDDKASDDEKPQHRVRITRPFYLGITEVTQAQYQAVTATNPSLFTRSEDQPVESISWNDAMAFCERLNALEKQELGAATYRLPTEAEWEYACRAGSPARYSFGAEAAQLGAYAWSGSTNETQPAGQKRPNAWGLFDMHGNVWEWCADGYDTQYYSQSPVDDPQGPLTALKHVIRGGAWDNAPEDLRSANRFGTAPDKKVCDHGFRVARDVSRR